MTTRTESAVEVRDLVKVYPRPGGGTLRALDGISFEVAVGEFFGFLGPNGAGKTTALEIIEGIRKPTSGEVRVLGIDPRRELDKVKGVMGVQLQAASYFSLLTIEEILSLFGSFYPKRRLPEELLETVGMGFSGVMFPTEALPGVLPDIVPFAVPHTALIEAIRGIALTGASITAYGRQLLVGAAWLAIAFTVAALSYPFTEE